MKSNIKVFIATHLCFLAIMEATAATTTTAENVQALLKIGNASRRVGIFERLISKGRGDEVFENGLWKQVEAVKPKTESSERVTIVGTGGVGTATAFSLLSQYITDEIVMIGKTRKDVEEAVKDLQDGSGFIKSPSIIGSTNYVVSKNSKICIVTAGVNQKPGQSRDELVQENVEVFEEIIPKIVKHSPDAVLIIVTNPVDIMTYVAWKLIGKKNKYKIIGSGTNLDSSRLRTLVAQDLRISPESVQGWVIGEHGDGSVSAWSGVSVSGINLRSIRGLSKDLTNSREWFNDIHKKVVNSAYEVIEAKGSTTWAVSLSVSNLVYSILHNIPNVHAVSTMVKGLHGIKGEVFMSLPCILGTNGVTHIIKQPLDKNEKDKLKATEKKMLNMIDNLKWKDETQTTSTNGKQAESTTPK